MNYQDAQAQLHADRTGDKPAIKYSVLLLYPLEMSEGIETFYHHVQAISSLEAISIAQNAVVAHLHDPEYPEDDHEPDEFEPLLCIEGHHYGQQIERVTSNA